MPLVDPEIIKTGEKRLFASILESFDEYQIEKLLQETLSLVLKERMQFKGGKAVALNNQIVYQFDYSSVAAFPVLINETGKFMGYANSRDFNEIDAEETESYEKLISPEIIKMRKTEFIEKISASINTETIAELFNEIFKDKAIGKVIYSSGDIRAMSGFIVYQLVYEIELFFSIFFDRKGNFIRSSLKDNGLKMALAELPEIDGL
jgi:hypothetical protein